MNISPKNGAAMMMNLLGGRSIPFLFIIDFEMITPVVLPLSNLNNSEILYDFEGFTNCCSAERRADFDFHKTPVSYEQYLCSFDKVKRNLEDGNSYLLNLTFPTAVETDLTLSDIFHMSRAKYRLMLKDQFVFFSPECFVKISDNGISSFPMKGTIKADIPGAEKKILEDEKELAEHITIVDLIRNDLNIMAKNVSVKRFRYIERVTTANGDLLQVSSEIAGDTGPFWRDRIGDIIFSLLPAGSVTGAPKKKTVDIIRASEIDSRGYYSGVCGIFNGLELNSCVMIRFIENRNGSLIYRSGGGITVYSNPASEYREMVDKIYVPAR